MNHFFLPHPHIIYSPAITDGNTAEVELIRALETSGFKTLSPFMRLHLGFDNLEVTLKAYGVWPLAIGSEPLFPDKSQTAVATCATAVGLADAGFLLTTATPGTIRSPAIRIVAELKANGADIDAGTPVTISAGAILLAE